MLNAKSRFRVALGAHAACVGVIVSLAAVGFRQLVRACTVLVTGHAAYGGFGRVASTHWPWLGVWFLLLAPAAAGTVYGPMLAWCTRHARPDPDIETGRGSAPATPATIVMRALASALCIGAGGSVGCTGPVVALGSVAAAALARTTRSPRRRARLLSACGASAALAAGYNAPLAGTFFGLELILRSFDADAFCAVMTSSIVATAIVRICLVDHTPVRLPSFEVHGICDYPLYAATGLLVGGIGIGFSRLLHRTEQLCDRVWRPRPEWARPIVGGIALGALLLALPQLYGTSGPALEAGIAGRYTLALLIVLLIGKMLATSLTIGIGGHGGVFGPNLFIGAMAGTAFGTVLHHLAPTATGSPGGYGLIGMSAAFAGATRAPITAVMIVFEITGTYTIVVPLTVAIAAAGTLNGLRPHATLHAVTLIRRAASITPASTPLPEHPPRGTIVHAPLGPRPGPTIRQKQPSIDQGSATRRSSSHGDRHGDGSGIQRLPML